MPHLALVTGASRGIGRAIARGLAANGTDLILVARTTQPLSDVANDLVVKYGIKAATIAIDLDDLAATTEAVKMALAQVPHLDMLVNAAGIFRFGTIAAEPSDLAAMMTTNVLAVHNLCRACVPSLVRSGHGRIFNISSIAGVEPFAPIGAYSASKHALVGYSRSLARELLPQGIKVTALCPDVVDTDMSTGSGMHPNEMLTPDDISLAINFVMALSPAAIVEHMTIGCKPVSHGARSSS